MNDRIDKKLQDYDPPNVNLEHNKNKLRRELLNADQYRSPKWIYNFSIKELITTMVVSIITISIVVISFIDTNQHSLDSTLENLNNTYAGFLSSNKTNYFDSNLRIFGKENEFIDLKVEKLYNHNEDKYSLSLKDIKSGELLDKIIIVKEKVYRMKNPKLQTLNTVNSHGKLIIELAEDLINSREFNSDSVHIEVHADVVKNIDQLQDTGLLLYDATNSLQSEINFSGTELNKMEINTQLNLDEYLKDNPIDLIKDLKNNANIQYIEEFYDPITDKYFNAIRIEYDIIESLNNGTTLRFSDGSEVIDSEKNIMMNDSSNIFSYYYFTSEDSFKYSYSSKAHKSKKIKMILVNDKTGEISGVNYLLEHSKSSINLSSLRFTKHSLHNYDNQKFDPAIDNLEFFANSKNIKHAFIKKFRIDNKK